MARCGGGALCTCAVEGGCGNRVDGTGQAGVDPYRVHFVGGCPSACEAAADCLADHVDVGLRYNIRHHVLSTRLSGDTGQQLRYGTDGGLLYTGTCPDTTCCNTTVNGLPDTGIVGGMDGAGRLIRPPGVIASYVQATRQHLDLTYMECVALRDGTPVVFPDYGARMSVISDAPESGPFDDFTEISQWDAATWDKVILHPSGQRYNPYVYPPDIDPGQGFGGMREPTQIGGTFLADVLERVGGRIVTGIGVTADAAIGVRDELLLRCLHDAAIVTVPDVDTGALFVDAGIACGVRLITADDAAAWPPQSILDMGGEWVLINHRLDDATITAYVDAGLQVLGHAVPRQSDAARMTGLGARGIVSDDPLYASGQTGRYRIARDQWAYRTPGHGLLTELTDSAHWRSGDRGFLLEPDNDPDGEYGLWVPGDVPASTGRWSILMGQLCPLPDPTAYQLNVQVQWRFASEPGDATSLGVLVAASDDRLILAPEDGDHYLVSLTMGGLLAAYKYIDGQETLLGSVDIGAVTTGTWYALQLTVASDGMTVTKTGPGDTQFFTTSDTDLRGPYLHLHKSQVDSAPYTAGFASVIRTPQ